MTTLAKQARDLAKALLLNQTPAAARIFVSRRQPVKAPKLPCLLVYTAGDSGEGYAGATPPQTRHTLSTVVEVIVADTDDEGIDDQLDAFEAAIKRRLMNAAEFVALFETITALRIDRANGDSGEQRFAGLRVVIDGVYEEHWQPVITDELRTVSLTLDAIDPADPNSGNTLPGAGGEDAYRGGQPGPEGRPEGGFTITLPQP